MDFSETFKKEFSDVQKEIEKEQNLREEMKETIKEIENRAREILVSLQGVYCPNNLENPEFLPQCCSKARTMFPKVQELYATLALQLPKDSYYRYNDLWRFTTQRLVFAASNIVFLESENLLGRKEAAQMLGIHTCSDDGFHLDIEDLLSGWILLAEELPRLSVFYATFHRHDRPIVLWRFVYEMENCINALNFKADSLKKRLEGLKSSSKRLTDVVYDLSIRGLMNKEGKSVSCGAQDSIENQSANTD